MKIIKCFKPPILFLNILFKLYHILCITFIFWWKIYNYFHYFDDNISWNIFKDWFCCFWRFVSYLKASPSGVPDIMCLAHKWVSWIPWRRRSVTPWKKKLVQLENKKCQHYKISKIKHLFSWNPCDFSYQYRI